MKVLHVTNWYPHLKNPRESTWIQSHINALDEHVDSKTIHIEIFKGEFYFSTRHAIHENQSIILSLPFEVWALNEIIYTLILSYALFKERKVKYDLINFHIAYPMLTYWRILKSWIKTPIVITEHWSAYHFNFNLGKSKKLKRIQNIFCDKAPVITVSNSLNMDIQTFSKTDDFDSYVIPNVVETSIFKYFKSHVTEHRFFMISQWKDPKDPLRVINAFELYKKKYNDAQLRIGGYGPQMNEMKNLVNRLGLEKNVLFLGPMNPEEIAQEMNDASLFVHSSHYETMSVVCAEAICCGCPVIASNVGGIPEFINQSNGRLIQKDDDLYEILLATESMNLDREKISKQAHKKFSKKEIGKLYYGVLKSTLDAVEK